MMEEIVKGVDHLLVRAAEADPLFSLLAEKLLLPVAWPVRTNPFFTSGALFLGNLNLEIRQASMPPQHAELYVLALSLTPFSQSLTALSERGIPHTPPSPFYIYDDQGWRITAWSTIYLGGLLGNSVAVRLFQALSKRSRRSTWEKRTLPTPFNRRYAIPALYNTIYRRGMISAVQYNTTWQTQHIQQELTHTGLDILKVYEIGIAVQSYKKAYDCWKALLEPHPEISPGVWKLPDGLHIHLMKNGDTGLKRMIWQVTSLNRAVQLLHKLDLLGPEKDSMPTLKTAKVQGLDIRLVQ